MSTYAMILNVVPFKFSVYRKMLPHKISAILGTFTTRKESTGSIITTRSSKSTTFTSSTFMQ